MLDDHTVQALSQDEPAAASFLEESAVLQQAAPDLDESAAAHPGVIPAEAEHRHGVLRARRAPS